MTESAEPSLELPDAYRKRAQSYVKHLVLRGYLERAAMIILSAWPDFVFVDGFSGPWKSTRADLSDTSFGIAVAKLREARDNWSAHGKKANVRCVFVEKRAAAFPRLEAATLALKDFDAKALPGSFDDQIDEIRRIAGDSFTLTFVDPTGWGFDLKKIAPLLSRKPGEVLVNFMYEHFRRFIDDQRPEIRGSQDRAFGGSAWREFYTKLRSQGVPKEEAVLEAFKHQLKTVCGFNYVASARIRHPLAEKTHFYLVYGTRHKRGLVEFRKAEKEALKSEEGFRSQAQAHALEEKTGQGSLMGLMFWTGTDPRFEDRARVADWLRRILPLRPHPYGSLVAAALERFSVTEVEFKDILGGLREGGEVEYVGMGPRQKRPNEGVTINWREAV